MPRRTARRDRCFFIVNMVYSPTNARTPEACRDISQAYAFSAYAWILSDPTNRTLKGCRGFLAPRPGCGCDRGLFPGVRKKRVPQAKFLRPLRGVFITMMTSSFSEMAYF